MSETELLNFKVSSALKSVIGRDLVTNDFVAIFELVKNSADAGAKKVDIVLDFSTSGSERILIADDGKGMSRDDIENKWLFVAYSAKKDGTEDAKDKVYAGNKGIGRFACDRLGATTVIQSRTALKNNVSRLTVDWGKFESDSKNWFSDIDIVYEESKKYDLPDQLRTLDKGVIVEIRELRDVDSWDRNKMLSLKRHLTKLINPFGGKGTKIEIFIHARTEVASDKRYLSKHTDVEDDDPNVVNGRVSNNILDLLEQKTTRINVSLSDGYFWSELHDRGEMIYKIREKVGAGSHLKDTEFKCEVYYLNQSAKMTFKSRMGVASIGFGSLFLFRNGFRVFPVGERGSDFWGLEIRKGQGRTRYLGQRDVMGRVDIIGPETKFKEASSRDGGLIETHARNELIDVVVKKVIRRLELYVTDITWRDKLDKDYETTERMYLDESRSRIIDLVTSLSGSKNLELLEYNTNLVSVLSDKSQYFEGSIEKLSKLAGNSNDDELIRLVYEAQQKFKEQERRADEADELARLEAEARQQAEEEAQKQKDLRSESEEKVVELESEVKAERTRNLFLAKSENRDKAQLESFIHQLIIYASGNKVNIENAIQLLTQSSEKGGDEILSILGDISQNNEKIVTTSRFATSANFMLDSAAITDDVCIYIDQYISDIVRAYISNIKVTVSGSEASFLTTFSPIELGMVIDNLVWNSRKAKATKVHIELNVQQNKLLEILISDNGKGLDKSISDRSRIFEKGYTTTDGSGLGLHHAKRYIESLGGEFKLAVEQPKRGTAFLLRMVK